MVKKTKLKQGTIAWERARDTRIGSSEVFDIVRYYSTEQELQNCGINAEHFKSEEPFITAWALYHKILNDGVYQKEEIPPELADYGHAVEPYGVSVIQVGRKKKIRSGGVYADDKLIVSVDAEGVAEEVDIAHGYDYGEGEIKVGDKFVCEQKSLMPSVMKKGLPFKHIIQAQYQIMEIEAQFYILQLIVLNEDTTFIRGKVCGMSKPQRYKYLKENSKMKLLYFADNPHLSQLIKTCLTRFFNAVEAREEPTPFIKQDKPINIIKSIRINSFYREDAEEPFELSELVEAKEAVKQANNRKDIAMQKIVDKARECNVSKFYSEDGTIGKFSKDGKFLITPPKERRIQ